MGQLSARLFASDVARSHFSAFLDQTHGKASDDALPRSRCEPAARPARSLGKHAPDDTAITFGTQTFTWGQWRSGILRLAGALRDAGVRPGDRLTVLDLNHLATVELTRAASALGAATVPASFRLSPDQVRYILEDSRPVILFRGASSPSRGRRRRGQPGSAAGGDRRGQRRVRAVPRGRAARRGQQRSARTTSAW